MNPLNEPTEEKPNPLFSQTLQPNTSEGESIEREKIVKEVTSACKVLKDDTVAGLTAVKDRVSDAAHSAASGTEKGLNKVGEAAKEGLQTAATKTGEGLTALKEKTAEGIANAKEMTEESLGLTKTTGQKVTEGIKDAAVGSYTAVKNLITGGNKPPSNETPFAQSTDEGAVESTKTQA